MPGRIIHIAGPSLCCKVGKRCSHLVTITVDKNVVSTTMGLEGEIVVVPSFKPLIGATPIGS